jgi:leucyl aminopeptidase (aminopeptidase T)
MKENSLVKDKISRGRILLRTCLGLKKDTNVLITYDDEGRSNADGLIEAARKLGLRIVPFHITKIDREKKPIPSLSRLMQRNDVTIFCVNQKRIVTYGHSDARVSAIKKGRRVAFLTQSLLETPPASDLHKIHARSHRLGRAIERSKHITVLSGKNYERKLEFSVKGRKSFPLSSILVKKGDWGAIPDYAEAAIAPVEGTGEGSVEIDGMIMGYGALKTPLILKFSKGKLDGFEGKEYRKQLTKLLQSKDKTLRELCELGLGANHLRTEIRGEFDDKKILGSAHIAIGDNHTIGGKNVSRHHIDFLISQPRLLLDGKSVILKDL